MRVYRYMPDVLYGVKFLVSGHTKWRAACALNRSKLGVTDATEKDMQVVRGLIDRNKHPRVIYLDH